MDLSCVTPQEIGLFSYGRTDTSWVKPLFEPQSFVYTCYYAKKNPAG